MNTQCADDVRAQTGSLDKLTQIIEMAVRLDDAFALVDEGARAGPEGAGVEGCAGSGAGEGGV